MSIYKIIYSNGSLSCIITDRETAYKTADNIGNTFIYKHPVAVIKISMK